MVNMEIGFKVAEVAWTAMASVGAKTIVEEAVKKVTPEDISTVKRICVGAATAALSTGIGTICRESIKQNINTAKNTTTKVINVFTHEENGETVIDVTGIEPIEIEE